MRGGQDDDENIPIFGEIMKKKLLVKIGLSSLEKPMTEAQALRYGRNAMPNDLRKAGFVCSVFHASQELHGSEHYRINYSK